MTVTQKKDIRNFVSTFALADELRDCTILLTGATGLIGSALVHCLLGLNRNISIISPVRNSSRARAMFSCYTESQLRIVECNLLTTDFSFAAKTDYIIHCAAPTSSRFFVEHPLDTHNSIYAPSLHLLEYSRTHSVKGFVYLSSLEVYGSITDDSVPLTEDRIGHLDTLDIRSSYPLAKRMVEHLCCLYAKEHGTPVTIARLTQTTGAGVTDDDNRAIVSFCRKATNGEDIVLHTQGESARPYCYITDAVSGILHVMLRGKAGEAYNIANEQTYCSARQLAETARQTINPDIAVRVELQPDNPYAAFTRQRLDVSRLRALGWQPACSLEDICNRLKEYFLENRPLTE